MLIFCVLCACVLPVHVSVNHRCLCVWRQKKALVP